MVVILSVEGAIACIAFFNYIGVSLEMQGFFFLECLTSFPKVHLSDMKSKGSP